MENIKTCSHESDADELRQDGALYFISFFVQLMMIGLAVLYPHFFNTIIMASVLLTTKLMSGPVVKYSMNLRQDDNMPLFLIITVTLFWPLLFPVLLLANYISKRNKSRR